MNYRQQIYNRIIEEVDSTAFRPVRYLPGGLLSLDEETDLRPHAVELQELAKSFGASTRRDRLRQSIESWDWTLVLAFNQEVSTEEFEEAWMEQVPIISKTEDTRTVFLYLEDADYSHPERRNSPKGTYAAYRIRAEIGPQ